MSGKDWQMRLQIMEALGWEPATSEEWPHMLGALHRECSLRQMADMLGVSTAVIKKEKAGRSDPRRRWFVLPTGEYLAEAARRAGVPIQTARARHKAGKPFDQPCPKGQRRYVDGKTVDQHAAEHGVTYGTMYNRLLRAGKIKPIK